MAIPDIDMRLGMGTAQFGNLGTPTTDEDSVAAVRTAFDAGIRYFDTAPHYGLGLAEQRLGLGLAGLPRDEYLVSTKVGRLLVPTTPGEAAADGEGFVQTPALRRRWDFSRDGVLRSVEDSLARLGLDRVDFVYLHDPDDHWEEASTTGVAALVELREQGVISAIGAGMNQAEMLAEFVRRCDIDLVLLAGRYTLLEQGGLDDLFPAARERGVGIIAAAVFNSGLLSREVVPDDAWHNYHQAPHDLIERARRIAAVCERHGVTLPEAAIQFPARRPEVVSVLVGMPFADQVTTNIRRIRTPIPEDLWSDLVAEGLLTTETAFPR